MGNTGPVNQDKRNAVLLASSSPKTDTLHRLACPNKTRYHNCTVRNGTLVQTMHASSRQRHTPQYIQSITLLVQVLIYLELYPIIPIRNAAYKSGGDLNCSQREEKKNSRQPSIFTSVSLPRFLRR